MKLSDLLEQLPAERATQRVYGEPYQVDGATVIPVAKIRLGPSTRPNSPRAKNASNYEFAAVPTGVFVIRGGEVRWVPAEKPSQAALIGVLTGLVAAVIGSLAVLRQPPWPRWTITEHRR